MAITLSQETQRLIEDRMRQTGIDTPDELVRIALDTLSGREGPTIEELDPQTQAAIEEGLAEADRGELQSWPEVRDELRRRFDL
ncbi:MAG: hypothetical protein ACAI43_22135 [Phycisphaerae bacterium]|nr:hypothetical protein [Tepidisphaeraceae bacterium]